MFSDVVTENNRNVKKIGREAILWDSKCPYKQHKMPNIPGAPFQGFEEKKNSERVQKGEFSRIV